MLKPKVSVILPAYNVAAYLAEALNSLQQQTLSAFECLVIDDGSTDQTAAIARQYVVRDQRFHLLQRSNSGLSAARNFGLVQARAAYIALLDADDLYHPDKLITHVEHLEQNPDVGVVYSASRIIREDGQSTWMHMSGRPLFKDWLLSLLCKNCVGHGSNAVFRRSIVEQIGNFDETLCSAEDLDFWLRIAACKRWKFYREPRLLTDYRVRASSLSSNLLQMEACYSKVLRCAAERSPQHQTFIQSTALAYMNRYLARLALTHRNFPQARAYLQQAWTADAYIFGRDPRSLLTLLAIWLSPLSQRIITRTLRS